MEVPERVGIRNLPSSAQGRAGGQGSREARQAVRARIEGSKKLGPQGKRGGADTKER